MNGSYVGISQFINPSEMFVEFKKEEIEQSIPQRFEQQAAKYPSGLAVKTRFHQFTYKDLNEFSNRIAYQVLSQRGEREEPVVFLLEQGAPLIAAILGILKAGKIYVPMDPSYPKSRIEYTIEDTKAELIVTDQKNLALSTGLARDRCGVINLDQIHGHSSSENPGLSLLPDRLAYIFYTSGSTGTPKGVVDNHRNVLHNIMRYTNNLKICRDDRLTLLQACSFSGSVSSLFSAILNGATSFPYNIPEEGMGNNLAQWLLREGITIYHSAPMIFRNFLIGDLKFPTVRIIRLEGDLASKVDIELYKKYFEPECILVHGLGATETGITRQYFITKHTEISGGLLPIGYPVEDMEVLLLDDEGREMSVNCIGEIGVKSRFLSPGYWRNAALTEAAFLSDPAGGEKRIYRTGDMGRMRPDRCLEYLGRKDFQLKIRGQKVEVAEVEAALLQIDDIKEAVVTTRLNRQSEPQLVAYLILKGTLPLQKLILRQTLAKKLPDYMIPSSFVILEKLPLDANGKVNHRGLPEPEDTELKPSFAFTAPRNSLEHQLVKIWENLLKVEPVGIRNNFFDLGGNSLLAVQMFSQIQDKLGTNLPPSILCQAPTIELLASLLRKPGDSFPLSSLVAIQPAGTKPPLFCVHERKGNVFHYMSLARHLGRDQPFFGLQARRFGGVQHFSTRFETMAAQYISDIQILQPKGPYFLGGFCIGGVIAFEIAQQLWSQGEKVALLALFGISAYDFPRLVSKASWRRYQYDLKSKLRYLYRHKNRFTLFKGIAGHKIDDLKGRICHKIYDSRRFWMHNPEQYIRSTILEAFRYYEPQTYPGRVHLFLTDQETVLYSNNPESDWKNLANGGLIIHRLPGSQWTMLTDPCVQLLSEELRHCLQGAQSEIMKHHV